MRRLPAIRRKGNYISEIDSARKRQRQYGDEEPLEYVDDLHGGGVLLEAAPSSGKIMTRRCRIVRQRDLKHEPEFYHQRRSRVFKAEPLVSRAYYGGTPAYYGGGMCVDKFVRKAVPPQHQEYAIYDEMDEYQESYYANDFEGVSPLYVMAQHHQLRSNLSGGGGGGAPLYRRLSTTSGCGVWSSAKGDDDSGGSGVTSDAILVADNNEIMVAEPSSAADDGSSTKMVHHHGHPMNDAGGTMDGDVLRRDFSSNVHEVVDYNARRLPAGAYAYDEEIQEQIEVVDDNDGGGGGVGGEPLDDELAHHQHHAYSNKFVSAEAPIDLHRLYDEMAKYKDGSNEELIEQFFADPEMTCPLNVVDLMNGAVNASPEANAQAVASLAMQINVLKRDLLRVRQELADWRTVCAAKEGPFVTPGRKFQPLGEVCRDWKISAHPPLREVDLVVVARQLGNYRTGGKQQQRNEDLIRRFIRLSLEKLIPHEVVREFTVKNRIQSRKDKARDIGEFAKNQITGIVLDLMGLYNVNELDERALTERGHYFNLANKLMKYAMNDMRRLSPKRREPPPI